MGKKIALVSFLCGAITGKKSPAAHKTEYSDSTWSPGQGSPEEEEEEEQLGSTAGKAPQVVSDQEVQAPIPPPPGRQPHHMRAASCHQHHSRSNSSVSKLTSSLSMKVLTASRREDSGRKLKHEDSIWKKTIILGEKCRIPDEDDDTILYDENGNRISSYHPKNALLSLSRQTSCADQDSRLGPRD